MADGAPIARRVLDVQHRWLVTAGVYDDTVIVGCRPDVQNCTLQTRKLISNDHGVPSWSEWEDVPVVAMEEVPL